MLSSMLIRPCCLASPTIARRSVIRNSGLDGVSRKRALVCGVMAAFTAVCVRRVNQAAGNALLRQDSGDETPGPPIQVSRSNQVVTAFEQGKSAADGGHSRGICKTAGPPFEKSNGLFNLLPAWVAATGVVVLSGDTLLDDGRWTPGRSARLQLRSQGHDPCPGGPVKSQGDILYLSFLQLLKIEHFE